MRRHTNKTKKSAANSFSGSFDTSGNMFSFSGSSGRDCIDMAEDDHCREWVAVPVTSSIEAVVCRCGTYKVTDHMFRGADALDAVATEVSAAVAADYDTFDRELVLTVAPPADGNILFDLSQPTNIVDKVVELRVAVDPAGTRPDPETWPAVLAEEKRLPSLRLRVYNRGAYTAYLTTVGATSGAKFEGVSKQIGVRAGESLVLTYSPVRKEWRVNMSAEA